MSDKPQTESTKKKGIGFYVDLGPVFGYFFRKKDPNWPTNGTIKAMHGINKLSLLMFIVCLIIMIFRYATR